MTALLVGLGVLAGAALAVLLIRANTLRSRRVASWQIRAQQQAADRRSQAIIQQAVQQMLDIARFGGR